MLLKSLVLIGLSFLVVRIITEIIYYSQKQVGTEEWKSRNRVR